MNVGLNFFVPTTEECKLVAYAEEEARGDQIWEVLTRGFGSFAIWKLGFFGGLIWGFTMQNENIVKQDIVLPQWNLYKSREKKLRIH